MRRHQSVHHRETGDQRQAHQHQRRSGAPGNREYDGNQQDEANLKKCWQANDNADQKHRPLDSFLSEVSNQAVGDLVCCAGFGHHFAEHGAQRNDDGDVSQRAAHAGLEGMHHA